MSQPDRIERLYAWVVTHADGRQGLPAVQLDDGMVVPLVGADMARIESLRAAAMSCLVLQPKLELVEFGSRTVLETHAGVVRGGPRP